jgi:hypothetical protein
MIRKITMVILDSCQKNYGKLATMSGQIRDGSYGRLHHWYQDDNADLALPNHISIDKYDNQFKELQKATCYPRTDKRQ